MTTSELEECLSTALHARAGALHDAPLTLSGVRRRAATIRRRRRLAVGTGVAAALAVLVPAGMLAAGPVDRTQELPPASPTPTPLPTPVLLDPGAPEGEPPRIAWTEGTTIHLPDGETLSTGQRYGDVHVVGGRVFAARANGEGDRFLDELDADGGRVTSVPIAGGVVANDDATAIAYRSGDGFRVVTPEGVVESDPAPGVQDLVALVGDATCSDGCAVWFSGGSDGSDGVGRVGLDGSRTEPVEAIAVRDVVDDRLVSALTEVDDLEPGSCSTVFEDGRPRWSTCDYTLGRFSPGATFVTGTDPYLDGIGQRIQAVLDAGTGERYVEFDAGDGFIHQRSWEDESHLLITAYAEADSTWRLFRAGVDGTVEVLAATQAPPEAFEPGFHLTESGAGAERP